MVKKDINDISGNSKKEQEKTSDTVSGGSESRPAPVKKLKRIPPSAPKKTPEPENTSPKRKHIVIGELPDYDAIMEHETEVSEDKAVKTEKPVNAPAKKTGKSENSSKKKPTKSEKKADKPESSSNGKSTKPEKKADKPESSSNGKSAKSEKKTDNRENSSNKKSANPEKKINEPEIISEDDTEKKKGFFARVKDLMYISAEDEEEDSDDAQEESEISEIPEEDGNFTVEEIEENTASTLESISEALAAINDEIPDGKTKQAEEPEQAHEPEKSSVQVSESTKSQENKSSSRNKKKKKSASGSASTKKSDTSQEKVPDIKQEETSVHETNANPEEITEPEKTTTLEENNIDSEKTSEPVSEHGEKSISVPAKSGKYNLLALVCIILAIVGIIAIINSFISNVGGSSSKEKFAKAVYPAVIMDINSFESPAELPCDQILSATIWSVVIDNEKFSQYKERIGVVSIPAADVEKFAVELFGEDIPELTHNTVGSAESKFYYNEETQTYTVQVKPDTFTYSPEVSSVSKEHGEYIVDVEYVEEHPEWMDKSVSKSAEFRLSKNDNGGYKINSMKIIPENAEE